MLSTSIDLNTIEEIELELANVCNFNCRLCFRNIVKETPRIPEYEDIKNLLDKMPKLTDVTIAGQMGEPSLSKHLLEVVAYLRRRSIDTTIYTNAEARPYPYYVRLAQTLGKYGKLCFGVFGATQETHEYYRPKSVLKNILKVYDICSKFCRCEIWFIIFDYNRHQRNFSFGGRNVIVYNTLPFREFFEYDCSEDIKFPSDLKLDLLKLSSEQPDCCPSAKLHKAIVDASLDVYHCFLEKFYNRKYCYLCAARNIEYLREHGCMGLCEFGDQYED